MSKAQKFLKIAKIGLGIVGAVANGVSSVMGQQDSFFANMGEDPNEKREKVLKELNDMMEELDEKNQIMVKQVLQYAMESYDEFYKNYEDSRVHIESRTKQIEVTIKQGCNAVVPVTLDTLKDRIEKIVQENSMSRWLCCELEFNNTSNRNGGYVSVIECTAPSTLENKLIAGEYIETEVLAKLNNNGRYKIIIPCTFTTSKSVKVSDIIQQYSLSYSQDELKGLLEELSTQLSIPELKENPEKYYVLSSSSGIKPLKSFNYDFYRANSANLYEDPSTGQNITMNQQTLKLTTESPEEIVVNIAITVHMLCVGKTNGEDAKEEIENEAEQKILLATSEEKMNALIKGILIKSPNSSYLSYKVNRTRGAIVHKNKKFIRFYNNEELKEGEQVEGDGDRVIPLR